MNNGLLLFFGVLLAMVSSWFGFVHSPQVQFGRDVPQVDEASNMTFPSPRSGAANRGRDIYRQNGCAQCHTQQIRQSGYDFSVVIDDFGTNSVAAAEVLATLTSDFDASSDVPKAPYTVKDGLDLRGAEEMVKAFADTGAVVLADFHPTGADIERGWGMRRTVGADYLLDNPVMLGSQRIGPDLANIGNRQPDVNWQLVHLFDPRLVVEDSVMPSYPFLFEKRPVDGNISSDALRYNGELVLDDEGRQIIPRSTAKDLVAYMLSLRIDGPVFEAPGRTVLEEEAEVDASDAVDATTE